MSVTEPWSLPSTEQASGRCTFISAYCKFKQPRVGYKAPRVTKDARQRTALSQHRSPEAPLAGEAESCRVGSAQGLRGAQGPLPSLDPVSLDLLSPTSFPRAQKRRRRLCCVRPSPWLVVYCRAHFLATVCVALTSRLSDAWSVVETSRRSVSGSRGMCPSSLCRLSERTRSDSGFGHKHRRGVESGLRRS